jgi:hypothetical protein
MQARHTVWRLELAQWLAVWLLQSASLRADANKREAALGMAGYI